jgi:hypothetical protein
MGRAIAGSRPKQSDRPPVHRVHTLQGSYQDEQRESIYRRIKRTN